MNAPASHAESEGKPPRRRRPSGPAATTVRLVWWVACVAIVGPILIGVIRHTFGF